MKPIWLLTMKCTEPPVRWPRRPDRPKHSAITPWPANAASPEISSGITMVRSSRRRAVLVLLGARLAEHHRIDDLQMRRIGGERQMHLVAVELAVRRGAEVIFHVAGAFDVVGRRRAALELVEDRAVRLAHHLRQHVEPAAMRHADDDLFDAERAAALDDLLQRRDHRLAAVEAEALGAGELHVAELLEALGLDQLVEDRALALAGEADLLVAAFDALLDPGLLRRSRRCA